MRNRGILGSADEPVEDRMFKAGIAWLTLGAVLALIEILSQKGVGQNISLVVLIEKNAAIAALIPGGGMILLAMLESAGVPDMLRRLFQRKPEKQASGREEAGRG